VRFRSRHALAARFRRAAEQHDVDHALVVFYEGERPRREVPDFALDKHTGRGRARKRGWDHWWTESCQLAPAEPEHYEAEARAIRREAQTEMDF
jgi:hypothetical protein